MDNEYKTFNEKAKEYNEILKKVRQHLYVNQGYEARKILRENGLKMYIDGTVFTKNGHYIGSIIV